MLKWLLLVSVLVAIMCMTVAFFIAKQNKRLDTVDVAWGLAFVVVASIVAGYEWQLRTALIALLVDIWAVRLTAHLIDRVRRRKEDPRYRDLTKRWKDNFWLRAYVSIFLFQAALVWAVSVPIVVAAGKSTAYAAVLTTLGVLVWLKGFIIEAIADKQLAGFTRDAANRDKILQSGLWKYSRHPNYYGEIVQWFGIALIACSARNGWIGLIGPVVLTASVLLVSGIPSIEKRRAGDLNYQKYKRRTSLLIPWFPKN